MRFLASVLVNTNAHDPVVYAVVLVFLTSTTLLATYLPARQAALVTPAEALRYE